MGDRMAISLRVASKTEQEIARDLVMSTYMKHGYLKEKTEFLEKMSGFAGVTITIVAENHNDMIGTLSVVLDSENKLPLDGLYPIETESLRRENRELCELSQFAVSEGGMKTSLQLCKYAKVIAVDIFHLTDFVITANPKHQSFYLKILKFVPFADDEVDHPHLSEVGATPLRLDLLTFEELYRHASGRSRFLHLHDFFFGEEIKGIAGTLRPQISGSLLDQYAGGVHV